MSLLLQAYYRQGVALQCLGRHAEALAAFASALAQDSKSPQLLTALTEATMKSPLKGALRSRGHHLLGESGASGVGVVVQPGIAKGETHVLIACRIFTERDRPETEQNVNNLKP